MDGKMSFVPAARRGSPAVGVRLIEAYAKIAESRRANNKARAEALLDASRWCGMTMLLVGTELAVAFVAVAAQ